MARLILHAQCRQTVRIGWGKLSDGEFITAACTTLPALQTEIREIKKELDNIEKEAQRKFADPKWLAQSIFLG